MFGHKVEFELSTLLVLAALAAAWLLIVMAAPLTPAGHVFLVISLSVLTSYCGTQCGPGTTALSVLTLAAHVAHMSWIF
jgi:hypothetical protein